MNNRKQIAAANWKMNLTYHEAEDLITELLQASIELSSNQEIVLGVPFPYLAMANQKFHGPQRSISAQNCSDQLSGAFTGETSLPMLRSIGINTCIIGHSERRDLFHESDDMIARKVRLALDQDVRPIFCCGEALSVREAGNEKQFVEEQLQASLFPLSNEEIRRVVIAYEPVWAIGTGKTATTQQAQEMHKHIRDLLAGKYDMETANVISILYGGSVKAGNAAEIFAAPDVDGGLVGGASLKSGEFTGIIKALSK